MPSTKPSDVSARSPLSTGDLKILRVHHIELIEEALKKVGSFGEVHLIVERGRLRYVRTIRSEPVDNPSHNPNVIGPHDA